MNLSPRCSVPIRLMREDGREEHYEAIAAVEAQLAFELQLQADAQLVEEEKRTGFVADALRRHGIQGASVAGPADAD